MKKLTESTPMKIASIIISYILAVIVGISAFSTGIMVIYKFYFGNIDSIKSEIMTDMAQNEANFASNDYAWGLNLEKYYSDKNIYYEIFDIRKDTVIETTYNGQEYIANATSSHYSYIEKSRIDEYTGEVVFFEESEHVHDITIYIAKDMQKNDIFSVSLKLIELGFKLKYSIIFILLISAVLLIVFWCYSFCAAGRNSGGIIKCNFIDKIPFDFITALVVGAAILSILIMDSISMMNLPEFLAVFFLVGSLDYFIGILYLLSLATRIKTKTIFKNTLLYFVINYLFKKFKKVEKWFVFVFSNLNLIYKTIIVLIGILAMESLSLIIIFNTYYNRSETAVIIFIIFNIIFSVFSLYLAIILQKIKQSGEKIAGGNLEEKIDTTYMIGDFKSFAESLNNINEGLSVAVEEKMKSERFKTELITNVSHDIKTPITSIINYVDLIKKEECENEKIANYIEVLDRQSGKLKKLVEDLVEASKASTGNITVNFMPCDVSVLLNQAVGEFEDKLNSANISPVLNIPEYPVVIRADGRLLWRIFDNLLNNVCKYALSGSRVYLDLKTENDNATIIFRNISKYSLNISSDELMERFVRGDTSRNTEGSGLGLSIAKSLIELQNGTMDLNIDGDLFKVTITIPKDKK